MGARRGEGVSDSLCTGGAQTRVSHQVARAYMHRGHYDAVFNILFDHLPATCLVLPTHCLIVSQNMIVK